MSSTALTAWKTKRRERLDELYAAHQAGGGTGPGRRVATSQLNWSIAMRLAGEFQGFARDLHDEAIIVIISAVKPPTIASVLQVTLALNRNLERGNAHPGSLNGDFLRLGVPMTDRVKSANPKSGEADLAALEDLNTARNAIAHSQPAKLAPVLGKASSLTLKQVKAWHAALNRLARIMDNVSAVEIARLTGSRNPW